MNTLLSVRPLLACILFVAPLFPAQNGGGNVVTPAHPATTIHPPIKPSSKNNRFAITFPNNSQTGGADSQAVADDLARRLKAKGFVLVKPLDVHCCNLQVQMLGAESNGSSTHENRYSLRARLTVLDQDGQFIYAKEYGGEAPAGGNQIVGAASEIAKAATEDSAFLKAIADTVK
ncbi:MAG TPA: hypothetical protein VG297_19375 [Bryobacteraceae bacterium]|nr:hypothetical protein [Bryobacteraceae bacterium]